MKYSLLIVCGLPTVVRMENKLQQRRFKLAIRVFPAHQESEESPLQVLRRRTEKDARNGKSTADPAFGQRSGLMISKCLLRIFSIIENCMCHLSILIYRDLLQGGKKVQYNQ